MGVISMHGRSISPGYAEGTAALYAVEREIEIPRFEVSVAAVPAEHKRLDGAIAGASRELTRVRDRVLEEFGEPQAEIFAAHLELMCDPHFISRVKDRIANERVNAEQAIEAEVRLAARALATSGDQYFRERSQDIRDVGRRLLRQLGPSTAGLLVHLPENSVLVARELFPSDTMHLDRAHVVAILTERGGPTSHFAIMAKTLGIPAVTRLEGLTAQIRPGCRVLVDGSDGEVIIEPSQEAMVHFRKQKTKYDQATAAALAAEDRACVTRDCVSIRLRANVGRLEELDDVRQHHLDGVGLFRTEFLFLHELEPPSYERQLEVYRRALASMSGHVVTIRTIDLGGDKTPAFLSSDAALHAALGRRGLRYALTTALDLFTTQLRALLAAGSGDLRVMFPMVLGRDDLGQAIELLNRVAIESGEKQLPAIGAMIETPASLFTLEQIAEKVDFLSIGTNDLTQFMLAVDRNSPDIAGESLEVHPAVLRAIKRVVEIGALRQLPVSVCGEIAGDAAIACLLVGLGIRELSMSPARALRVRYALRQIKVREMELLAEEALASDSVQRVEQLLARIQAELG